MVKCSPLKVHGAVPTATSCEPARCRNWESDRRLLQVTQPSYDSAAGRKMGPMETQTKFTGRDILPVLLPRAALESPPPTLVSDPSRKAKPPPEPSEVPWLCLSACTPSPTQARRRDGSLGRAVRICGRPSAESKSFFTMSQCC